MIHRSKLVAVAAVVFCSFALNAGATSMSYTYSKHGKDDVKLVIDGLDSGSYAGLIAGIGVNYGNGLGKHDKGPKSIQSILDHLKPDEGSIKHTSFVLSELIGHPVYIHISTPSVSPIPEPRTWALYGFGALIAAWVIRRQLRAPSVA